MAKVLPQKPRIILILQFYDPEPAYKGQAFAEAVANAGYDVEVVTGFPNYPNGKVYDGYRIKPIDRSEKNGISITRLPLYPSHSNNKFGRVLNYLSFAVSVFLYLAIFAKKASLVHVYSPPVTVGLAAAVAQLFRRFPIVVDIHDLWPDTLPATGMLTNNGLLRIVEYACNWLYRRSDHIVLHSNGFRKRLIERGVPPEKMTTIIGWANEAYSDRSASQSPHKLSGLKGLKVLYAGNMGSAQALESVLETACIMQNAGSADIATFCFLGSGLSKEGLLNRTHELGLTNAVFLPRVPPADVGKYLLSADALLVHLRDDPLFEINMPSKTQAYMLAGRPILMSVRGEAAALIKSAKCGITVLPENPGELAAAVHQMAAMTEQERNLLGKNGRAYYWQNLCMEKGIHKLTKIFAEIRRP